MFLAGGYSVFGDGEDDFEWRFVMLSKGGMVKSLHEL